MKKTKRPARSPWTDEEIAAVEKCATLQEAAEVTGRSPDAVRTWRNMRGMPKLFDLRYAAGRRRFAVFNTVYEPKKADAKSYSVIKIKGVSLPAV